MLNPILVVFTLPRPHFEDFLYYSDINQVPPADEISPALFRFMKDMVDEKKWTEADIEMLTQEIVIRYSDGGLLTSCIDLNNDNGIVDEIEMIYAFGESSVNEKFTFFRDYNGALTYINTDNISVIELPLVQTESAIFRVQMAALEGENMVSTTEDN